MDYWSSLPRNPKSWKSLPASIFPGIFQVLHRVELPLKYQQTLLECHTFEHPEMGSSHELIKNMGSEGPEATRMRGFDDIIGMGITLV